MRAFPDIGEEDAGLLGAATEAARAAAEVHSANPPPGADWSEKGWADFVTDVDREAERRAVEVLERRYPGHRILAEEAADAGGDDAPGSTGEPRDGAGGRADPGGELADGDVAATFRWIVDPLDGTTNWLHGYPEHAVSVAGLDEEGGRVSVVLNSATGELFDAVRGAGSRRDGERIRTSERRELRTALVGTGFPFKKPEVLDEYLRTLGRVLRSTSGVRRGGSAALDLCDVACGRLDLFWELWLMPWDVAGGALIIREAEGVFRPLEFPGVPTGPPPDPRHPELRPGAYIAGTPRLLGEFEALVTPE